MKVIIEMSPSEAVMLNDHVNDLLLAASNEEMKQTTQLEAPKTAKKRKAQKQDDAPSQPEQTPQPAPQPTPEQMPVPEPVIVPATQLVPTAVPIQAAVAAPAPIPTAAPRVFTRPEIAAASAQLRDAGKLNALTALLAQFGVPALTDLNDSQLQLFAQQLIAMGAKL